MEYRCRSAVPWSEAAGNDCWEVVLAILRADGVVISTGLPRGDESLCGA